MTKKDSTETIVKLNIGDVVMWTSQANGSSLKKRGSVVEVIPAGNRPTTPLGHHTPGSARKSESYVIEVVQVANGRARKPKRYWPLVSLLTKVDVSPVAHAISGNSMSATA